MSILCKTINVHKLRYSIWFWNNISSIGIMVKCYCKFFLQRHFAVSFHWIEHLCNILFLYYAHCETINDLTNLIILWSGYFSAATCRMQPVFMFPVPDAQVSAQFIKILYQFILTLIIAFSAQFFISFSG